MSENLDDEVISKLPIKELKHMLDGARVSYVDCFEKPELINRVKEARDAGRLKKKEEKQEPITLEKVFMEQMGGKGQMDLMVNNMKEKMIPMLIQQISGLSLPPIQESTPEADYGAEGVGVEEVNVPPENIEILLSGNTINVTISQFSAKLKEFSWYFSKADKFPRLKDNGKATANLKKGSIKIGMEIGLGGSGIAMTVGVCEVLIDKLSIKTSGTKASFLYNTLISLFSSMIKKQIAAALSNTLRSAITEGRF